MQAICTQLSNSQDWKEVKPKRNSNVFKIEWKPAYAAIALGGPIPLCFFHFDYADYSSAHDLVEKNEFETMKQKIEAIESNDRAQAEVLSVEKGWLGQLECAMIEIHYTRSDGWECLVDYRVILGANGWIKISGACTFSDHYARRELLKQLAKVHLKSS